MKTYPTHITAELLKVLGYPKHTIKHFQVHFPEGCQIHRDNALEAAKVGVDFVTLSTLLFEGRAVIDLSEEVKQPAYFASVAIPAIEARIRDLKERTYKEIDDLFDSHYIKEPKFWKYELPIFGRFFRKSTNRLLYESRFEEAVENAKTAAASLGQEARMRHEEFALAYADAMAKVIEKHNSLAATAITEA